MVFDAHSDIWSDVTVKFLRGETDIFRKYHCERLKKGGIEGSILAMWIDPPYDKEPTVRLQQIMEAIEAEIPCCQDILAIVHDYEEMKSAKENGVFYAFIGCEGLSGIGEDIEKIDMLYQFGVRHASLTWNEKNALAAGARADADSGLTKLGIRALHKIQESHMLLDVSHLNDKSFWDVMHNATGPVVATHSDSRSLCAAPRNLTDEMIKEIAKTGGMIGINAYPDFVSSRKEEKTVDTLARHIEHIAEIAGIDNVGFGFDFCEFLEDEAASSFSADDETKVLYGLEDASKVPNMLSAMQKIGFTKQDIEKVSYQNWHRMIQNVM